MPAVTLDPTLTMSYADDCFADPWRGEPDVALLVHGVAESGQAWAGWVPTLARTLRVLRPDLRGFGGSTAPPEGYDWSPASFARDLVRFLDALDVGAVHLVGAKVGGTIALQFAADYPERTRSVSIFSSPVRSRHTGGSADLGSFPDRVRAVGVRGWAAETQRARLGTEASAAQLAWWTDFMDRTDPRVCVEVTAMAGRLDISDALPRIQAPALIATTADSALTSVEVVRAWQRQIPRSELLVLPGDSYHVAAVRPEACARHTLDFIERMTNAE